MALAMASMAGLRGSSPAVMEGSLQLSGSSRFTTATGSRIGLTRPGFSIRAQQGSAEIETGRRAMLGLVAAGIATGSFVQAVLAEAKPLTVGPPPPPSAGLRFSGASAGTKGLVGGWQPIKNPEDPHVQEIAEYAVEEHNKQAKTKLQFVKVNKGETQVVAGTNYKLFISAKDGAEAHDYGTIVLEKLSGTKELLSFEELIG